MALESRRRSFSTSSNGSIDAFINLGKRHRHHEIMTGNEPRGGNREAVQDTDAVTEASIDTLSEKAPSGIGKSKWWTVYAMHFLFMWNSRTYEYVSVSQAPQLPS